MVLVLLGVLRYAIPDAPINLLTQLSRERLLVKENMYSFERTKSSRGVQTGKGMGTPLHPANVSDQLNNFGLHKRVNTYNLRVQWVFIINILFMFMYLFVFFHFLISDFQRNGDKVLSEADASLIGSNNNILRDSATILPNMTTGLSVNVVVTSVDDRLNGTQNKTHSQNIDDTTDFIIEGK